MTTNTTTNGTKRNVHPDMRDERRRGSFDVERLTNMLDGGVDRTARRRRIETLIANDPSGVFDNTDNSYMHRTERHRRALAKHVRMVELCRSGQLGPIGSKPEDQGHIIASEDFSTLLASIADDLPTSLHWVMFVPNIVSLCDEEQKAEWLPLCRDWKMIGCYAQTEVGHGSNVRALETTATFAKDDKDDDDDDGHWIVHSPSLTSTKFWPGTLGRTANHAMVIARLIDGEGIDRGVHNFLVPLRDMNTHKPLHGITTGDVGPKIGYNNMDNGFCRFNQVRIPRRNMAMRFAMVDRNGRYTKKVVSDATGKIAYITMMLVRALIVVEAGNALAKGATIAIRYSAVRRQGFGEDGQTECQILDYRQQQHRLFPLLAASYCFFFTGKLVLAQLKGLERRLVENPDQRDDVHRNEVTDIHASTSALKSFTTTVSADGIEDCRKACGGHGFLMSSGLPELLTTFLQNPTVEGDNHMLPQQVVKVLLKLVQAVREDDRDVLATYEKCNSRLLIPSIRSILMHHPRGTDGKGNRGKGGEGPACKASSPEDFMNLDVLLEALRHRAARLLLEVAHQIQVATATGHRSLLAAWNDCLVQMSRVSRAYSLVLLVSNFVDGINEERSRKGGPIGAGEVSALTDLARLFALYWMEKEAGDFLEDGYMTHRQVGWVRQMVLDSLDRIRPNAVSLVDAYDFSDFRLKSALGRYDGDVYPALMETARRDPLNRTEPGPGYEPHLRRLVRDGVGTYTGTIARL